MGIDRNKYLDAKEVKRLRTTTEAWAVLDLKDGKRQGLIAWMLVDLALTTGLRVSEMAQLKIGDFKASQKSLTVTRVKRRKAVSESLGIPPAFIKHLREFIAWKKTVGESVDPDAALFVGQRGPMTHEGLRKVWKTAIERAGLPRAISIHCARHTLAVFLLKKTNNLKQVQQQLGHSSPVVTGNLYAQVQFDDMVDGVTDLYEG